MSEDDPRWKAFLDLFLPLPRHGPGSPASTRAVLEMIRELPESPRVIDAGCGAGASTLVLAEALPTARILAVDVLEPVLERLREKAEAAGFGDRIETRRCSMVEIDEPAGSVDLIWSEGAIYEVGIEAGLRAFHELLRPGGYVAFSEACWFVGPDRRPPELVEFWNREYPAIRSEDEVVALIEGQPDTSFRCEGTWRLEAGGWTRDYYEPLAKRCAELKAGADPVLAEVIAGAEREIAIFREHHRRYGYTFFVLRKG